MKTPAATFWAFVVAAIVPAVALAVLGVIRSGELGGMVGVIIFAPFSIAATIFLAVPAFFIFTRLGWVNLWSTLLVGAVIGAIVATLLRPHAFDPMDFWIMCSVGILSAAAFWITRNWLTVVTRSE